MKVENLEDIYELSPMQQGMLFHSLLSPDSGVYVQQFCFALSGDLDKQAFSRAWQTVIERHAVLRTAFFWEELEKPVQVVYQSVDLPLVLDDWRGLPAQEQEERWLHLLQSDRRQGFVLTEAPVMRLLLVQTGDAEYRFVWSHHHLLVDGWSVALLFKEVVTFYHAYAAGRGVYVEASRPYGDYLAWLQEQDLREAEAFWRGELGGFYAPTSPRVGSLSQRASGNHGQQTVSLRFSAEQTEFIHQFARQQRITINTLFQGAWGVLLSRYSGEEDVMFGVTVSGRSDVLEGAEEMIGLFINTLPLRMQVSPEESVSTWLQRLQDRQAEIRKYEYTPLNDVQVWSDVPTGTPLFESILVFENYPMDENLLGASEGLDIRVLAAVEQTNYPLTVTVLPGKELAVNLVFETNRFEMSLIERMVQQLGVLVNRMAEQPMQLLSELALLSPEEQVRVQEEWALTDARWAEQKESLTIQQWFAQVAMAAPERVALEFEGQTMTYGELHSRSNRLARHLRMLGVGPDVQVGLCLDRSFEQVVGLLGILKAGGAYVPIDPTYPVERIALMLEDADLVALLTQQALVAQLPAHTAHTVCLDADWGVIAEHRDTEVESEATPDHLAYMIYTSGSTGRPKAVMVEQGNFVSALQTMQKLLDFQPSDVMPLMTSLAFDIVQLEMLGTLLAGGRLVILKKEQILDLPQLVHDLDRFTMVQTVPTLMSHIVQERVRQELDPQHETRVRKLLIGGEAVSPDLLTAMQEQYPHAEIHILYGPTEATIWCTGYHVPRRAKLDKHLIGSRFPNAIACVFDAHQHVLPVGVPGELYIAGPIVTRGYYKREDITMERYVTIEGRRWYRTGDLVRQLADENLEYLGRIDNQVKIRGFRIELGEIEKRIAGHAGVVETVVIAREDVPGQKQLVAYLKCAAGRTIAVADMRSYLMRSLPEYMVPQHFVFLDEFPTMPNGKINRRALPMPDGMSLKRTLQYVAPRTPVQEVLVGIWSDVLNVDRIGIHDNFFELGGHSLLATQVMSRIVGSFQVQLPLGELFAGPTILQLAAAVERTMQIGQGDTASPILPVPRTEHPPLTFAQERLWFVEQLTPGTYAYNIPEVVRLQGALDVEAMERAFGEVIRRHESLRTTFSNVDGKPLQIIHRYDGFTLPMLDMSHLPQEERWTIALKIANEWAVEPFDLERGPLMNARMIKLGEDDHLMVPIFHHIISDGWSMGVLFTEIVAHYDAFRAGKASPLEELTVQYADFAYWQRDWMQGEAIQNQLAYWKEQLSGDLPVLQLPTDHPRPNALGFNGQFYQFQLPQALCEQLYTLAKQEGVTMYMTMLSAFNILLYRYTGLEDILVGTPIANRNKEELENLIGVFVNPIVLRTDLSGTPTFRELLAQVRKVALDAYAHQDLPFEKLVEELQPERDLSHHPIFQVMFVMQNAPKASLQLPGITLEVADLSLTRVGVKKATAKFDMTLHVVESEQGMIAALEYNTDLFEEGTMMRMADHLQSLLENVVTDADQTVDELLPMLTDSERHQVLYEWNRTERDWGLAPHEMTLPHLITAQAERTPEAVAVECEGQQLSYAEFNRRANQLAHHLQTQGIGPEKRVALFVEPSAEMLVGILGIMKAGGAYVPIDATVPADRVGHVLKDSEASVLLTKQHLMGKLPVHAASVICMDSDWGSIAVQPEHNPVNGLRADHLAYIIYTSGSTGTPKGVMIEQRGVVNYMLWAIETIDMSQGEGATVHSSIGFDMPMTALYLPLLVGKRVVIVNHAQDVGALSNVLMANEKPFGLLKLTPAHLQMLNQQLPPETLAGATRAIVFGGETLMREHLVAWRKHAPKTVLINEYGPTEATIACTAIDITQETQTRGKVPIGRPLPNTKLYVVDRHLQPVPIGVIGELLVGGDGLARGYVNQPELTAEKFIDDPFSPEPGKRLYRTGDLVRYLPDGNLEFVGRIDNQVKIRGYRIELGEIEEMLLKHPAVREAVVLAREESTGDKRLVAYVTATGAELSVHELRDHLKRALPEYMVPTSFMVLDQLPLNANGKVDRKALPAPEQDLSDDSGYVAPRDEVEKALADIFAELLYMERVGIHDNFFQLGGHSLLATQLVSRVKQLFEIHLQVREVFEHSTVAELAEVLVSNTFLEQADKMAEKLSAPIPRLPKQGEYALSHAQERIWFVTQMDERALEGTLMTLMLNGPLDPTAFLTAVRALPDHHSIMRTTFGERLGKPYQIVREEMDVPCAYHDLSGLEETTRKGQLAALVMADKEQPIDLMNGPLYRMALYKLSAEQHLFVVNSHHIAYDGWSLDVFMRDIATGYMQLIGGQSTVELPSALQYIDFSVWHNDLLASGALDLQRQYWLHHLDGVRGAIALPYDEPSTVQADPAQHATLHLEAATATKLRALTQATESTLYMTMLSALNIWLSRVSGDTDITVGSPLSGRNHRDLENLIGVLINPVAMRTDLTGNPTGLQVLERVKDVAFDAYANQDYPFDLIVNALRSAGRVQTNLYNVVLIGQNAFTTQKEFAGVTCQFDALQDVLPERAQGAGGMLEDPTVEFDIVIDVLEIGEDVLVNLIPNKRHFTQTTFQSLVAQFEAVLNQFVHTPDLRLTQFELPSSEDDLDDLF